MNRPKLEDFYDQDKFYKAKELVPIYVSMVQALDKYCDELEKALDKACKLIDDNYGSCPYDVKEFCLYKGDCDGNSIKCWKEYLLND